MRLGHRITPRSRATGLQPRVRHGCERSSPFPAVVVKAIEGGGSTLLEILFHSRTVAAGSRSRKLPKTKPRTPSCSTSHQLGQSSTIATVRLFRQNFRMFRSFSGAARIVHVAGHDTSGRLHGAIGYREDITILCCQAAFGAPQPRFRLSAIATAVAGLCASVGGEVDGCPWLQCGPGRDRRPGQRRSIWSVSDFCCCSPRRAASSRATVRSAAAWPGGGPAGLIGQARSSVRGPTRAMRVFALSTVGARRRCSRSAVLDGIAAEAASSDGSLDGRNVLRIIRAEAISRAAGAGD